MWAKIAQLALKDFLPLVVQALVDKFGPKGPAQAVAGAPAVVK